MKRAFDLRYVIAFALALAISACATTGTPQEKFIADATNATLLVDQVVLAADVAVRANKLKGQDAVTTLAAVRAARDGLNAAKAMAVADPTAGTNKIVLVLAMLTATRTYLATLGAQP